MFETVKNEENEKRKENNKSSGEGKEHIFNNRGRGRDLGPNWKQK